MTNNGSTATFSVTVTGTGPFSYQWRFDGANLPENVITTVAGTGEGGYSGDNGMATNAKLKYPSGEAVDGAGNVYIADTSNAVIRMVGTNGIITTVAGNGTAGYFGDNGMATNAELRFPRGVAVDGSGNVFIADTGNAVVRRVGTNGIITTVAGNGTNGFSGDGGLATNANLYSPMAVVIDASGNLFIADSDNERVRKVDTNGVIWTVAGDGDYGFDGDGGAATNTSLWLPVAVAVDGSDNLYIADEGNQRVRKVGTDGIISTVAGSGVEGYSGDNGPAIAAGLYYPDGVAVDGYGDIFISDYFTNRIRRVAPNGIITTLAGNGTAGETGDGGAAASAELDGPAGLGLDGAGNVFVCDSGSNRVREIVLSGVLTLPGVTLSEGGSYQVVIRSPSGSVTSQVATLTVAAPPVVIIQPASQDILAGGNVTFSVSAAGSPPLSYAWLSNSTAVAGATNTAYSDNGVQLTDSGSQFVCVVTNVYGSVTSSVATLTVGVPPLFSVPPSNQTAPLGGSVTFTATNSGTGPLAYQWVMNGTNLVDFITTVAGDGGYGFSGNGVPATNASLYYPYAIAVDATGNLFIADTDDQRIRKVDTNGIITTVAGDGGYGYNGDNVPATNTSLYSPEGVAVDAFGNLFIGDTDNYRIRKVGTNGIITTVA